MVLNSIRFQLSKHYFVQQEKKWNNDQMIHVLRTQQLCLIKQHLVSILNIQPNLAFVKNLINQTMMLFSISSLCEKYNDLIDRHD